MSQRVYVMAVCGGVVFVFFIIHQMTALNLLPSSDGQSSDGFSSADKIEVFKDESEEKTDRAQHRNLASQDSSIESIQGSPSREPNQASLEHKAFPGLRECANEEQISRYVQRGEFWVLENYIKAEERFLCGEAITYATHGEYGFLHNLVEITARWQGPVSVAVYAPGKDFRAALETILRLRNCESNDIKIFVSFHIFFEKKHFPRMIPNIQELAQMKTSCSRDLTLLHERIPYRQEQNLPYPVNVARNIAISNSGTFFTFPSDIELLPSLNIIPEFFKMLRNSDASKTENKRVYVLPVFEIQKDQFPPENKFHLISMLEAEKAFLFHQNICYQCHTPPKYEEWKKAPYRDGLSVFHVGKRYMPHKTWEPFYIGTGEEPVFDERLTWEGRANKMTQAYAMCLLDYEYHILDNAFLVHRPGIKHANRTVLRSEFVKTQNRIIFNTIGPEYKKLYGTNDECHVMGVH